MKYLVDSDYVADYPRGREHALPLFQRLLAEGISISIITFAEVYEGIYYGHNRIQHERGWRVFLKTTPVLGITRSIAKQYALLHGELGKQGQLIDQPDLFIAATALHHHLTLVTRNTRDYTRIPNLQLYQAS